MPFPGGQTWAGNFLFKSSGAPFPKSQGAAVSLKIESEFVIAAIAVAAAEMKHIVLGVVAGPVNPGRESPIRIVEVMILDGERADEARPAAGVALVQGERLRGLRSQRGRDGIGVGIDAAAYGLQGAAAIVVRLVGAAGIAVRVRRLEIIEETEIRPEGLIPRHEPERSVAIEIRRWREACGVTVRQHGDGAVSHAVGKI